MTRGMQGGRTDDGATFTFRWDETDEWAEDTPERLKAEVAAFRRFREAQLDFPIEFRIEAAPGTVSPDEALIILGDAAAAAGRVIAFGSGPALPGQAALVFELNRIVASFAGVASVSLQRLDFGPEVTADLAADALVTIGLAFLQIGRADAAAEVIAHVGASAPSLCGIDVAGGSYVAFAASGRVLDALRLARAIGAAGTDDAEVAELMLATAAIGENVTEEARNEYRSVMGARAERRIARGANEWAGADLYNVANSYRASHRPLEAIRSYIRCARLAPDYRDRDYFNAELAGMLFMTEHFEFAAAFYGRAVEIRDVPWTRALYADALMYAGRYKEAEDVFGTVVDLSPEWWLKHELLPTVRAAAGGDALLRRRSEAWAATTAAITGKDRPLEKVHADLRSAIALDALTEDAWYWLALMSAEDQPEDAAQMMLIAALARRHDGSSWALAFILEWVTKRREARLLSIAASGLHLAGQDFRDQTLDWARSRDQEADRETVMRLLARAAEMQRSEDEFTLRFAFDGGLEEIQFRVPKG